MPGGGVMDPDDSMARLMIHILIAFAEYERKLISVRTKEGLHAIRERGGRYSRWAEYGWRWEKVYDSRLKKKVNVKVPDENERAILRKVVELRSAGRSFDQIRQHLNYEMKARTRTGGEWNTGRVGLLFRQGLGLIAETTAGNTEQTVASVNGDEEYGNPVEPEDEIDDRESDQVALHQNRLPFISLVAFSQDVKAIRAALAAGLTSPMQLRDVRLIKDEESVVPSNVWPLPQGYRIDTHRLGCGSIHALFIGRQQGFLRNDSDDALWEELKHERFTTPLLRAWLPYIRRELEIKNVLSRCYTLDCTCCVLNATSTDLDSIVESGLKNGLISIQEEAALPQKRRSASVNAGKA